MEAARETERLSSFLGLGFLGLGGVPAPLAPRGAVAPDSLGSPSALCALAEGDWLYALLFG